MNIIITEKQFKFLKESVESQKPTEEEFVKQVKMFLYNILSAGKNSTPTISPKTKTNDFWKMNGLNNTEVLNKLKRFGITEYDDGLDGYRVPKKNFDRKVSRLYYDLFPEQEELITEDGEGMAMGGDGGVVTAGSAGGSFEAPLTLSPIKRTIPSLIGK